MHSESKAENKNWRSKLDELSGLPDEQSPVLGNAWDKLENRLHPKPKPKRQFAFWAAAAALLCMVIFSWFKLQQGHQVLTPELVVQPQQTQQTQPDKVVSQLKSSTATQASNNKLALKLDVKPSQKSVNPIHGVKDDSNLTANRLLPIQNTPVEPLVAQAPILIDTFQQRLKLQTPQMQAVQTASIAVNKPKVIHINDINPTANNGAAIVQAGKPFNRRVRINSSNQNASENQEESGHSTFNVKIPF